MKRVVVTGIGVISPVGNTVEEFWTSLKEGKCGIGNITKFDTTDFKVKNAAEVKDFEPTLYMEKSEVRKTDLFVQYALAAASQAVADSGIKGNVDEKRFGVYFGSGIGGMNTFIEQSINCEKGGAKKVSPHFIPMMIANMATGRVAIAHGAKGVSLPIVTACATSTNEIGEAYRAIKHGYADAIITGGAEAAINPLAVAGFTNCKALTCREDPSEVCIPFDVRRDGFVMGEGAGSLILEEYDHAVARGAKIYAEICGYGNSCDAYHVTAPQPEGESGAEAIRQAVEEAGILDETALYINAHGTSTPMNDRIETAAIKKVFGQNAYKVMVSSTKSMTGHMLGAAGAVEAIATVLALKEGIVPPTIGLSQADPDCDLDYVPTTARKVDIKAGVSTSLGFGGHNACIAFKKA